MIVLSSLIIGICYLATQDPVSLKGGKPWDSTTYYYMAEQVRHGTTIKASEPFAYRIGLPYLVGLFFENDIFLGFKVFNVFFALITILILIKFCERFIESYRIIFTISMLYVVSPNGPFRFGGLYPIYTDVAATMFSALILYRHYTVEKFSLIHCLEISALTFCGSFVREMVLLSAFAGIFSNTLQLTPGILREQRIAYGQLALRAIPLVAGLIGLAFVHEIVEVLPTYYSFRQTAVNLFAHNISNPVPFLLGCVVIYGPAVCIIPFARFSLIADFFCRNLMIAIYFIGVLVLSFVGGYHTDRLLFWGAIVALPVIGIAMENHLLKEESAIWKVLFFGPILIAQLLAFRVFGFLPDMKKFLPKNGQIDFSPELFFFAPYGADVSFYHMVAAFMPTALQMTLIMQYTSLLLLLLGVFGCAKYYAKERDFA